MKSFAALFLSFALLLPMLGPAARAAGPSTSAASAILVDAGSGRVLYEKDAHTRRGIASTTKLMTALVAAESVTDLNAPVEILREDTLAEGSSMYLRAGETVTVEALLYGLLLQSGNDAALALARFCAGSVAAFVALMNEKAQALGMADTHFANPNGLDAEGHYSTAADMAILAAACMDNELVAKTAACGTASVGGRTFVNHNKLLRLYPGCVGMKTGYTSASGRTLVSAARRDGQLLLCVTLNDPDDWRDHAALFDYGFETYPLRLLAGAGKTVGLVKTAGALVPALWVRTAEEVRYPLTLFDYGFETYPLRLLAGAGKTVGLVKTAGALVPALWVRTAEEVRYPLTAEEQVRVRLDLPDRLPAPAAADLPVGGLTFTLDGAVIGRTELVCAAGVHADPVPARGPLERLWALLPWAA